VLPKTCPNMKFATKISNLDQESLLFLIREVLELKSRGLGYLSIKKHLNEEGINISKAT